MKTIGAATFHWTPINVIENSIMRRLTFMLKQMAGNMVPGVMAKFRMLMKQIYLGWILKGRAQPSNQNMHRCRASKNVICVN